MEQNFDVYEHFDSADTRHVSSIPAASPAKALARFAMANKLMDDANIYSTKDGWKLKSCGREFSVRKVVYD